MRGIMSETLETTGGGMLDQINSVFNNHRLRKIWVKWRILFALLLFAVLIYYAKPNWFWAAFGVSMFGEFIQLWCFASLDKKGTLAFNGLYKYVRNPMYLGRFFIALGYLLLLEIWYVGIILAVPYFFYMYNRVRREEAILVEIFGEPYEAYLRKVNRFLPSRGEESGKLFFWKWKLLFQNHGPANLLAVLISYGLIYAWLFH